MSFSKNSHRRPITAHIRARKWTARLEEYQELQVEADAHAGPGGAADFTGWSSPQGQRPWGEIIDLEEVREEDAQSEKPSIPEWRLPGT
jgi:hypothetical protein